MNGLRESAADLANEVMVQKIIEDKTGCRLIKQQTTDPMDYIAVRDLECSTKTVSLVEMRARSCPHTQYNELFFGRHKFIQLNQVAFALWIPVIFYVTFTDGIRWIDLTKVIRPEITYGNRGNPVSKRATDNEPVVLLPIKLMREL